jgi:hypothetical protein
LLEGAPCWAALVGRGGYRGVGYAMCACLVLGSRCVLCFAFFAGFKRDSPSDFQGTLLAVPDSSPRASAGVPFRFPQMLKPSDRTVSPWLQMPFRGAASADPRV